MTMPVPFRWLVVLAVVFISFVVTACATPESRRAVAAVTVAPDGKITVRRFQSSQPPPRLVALQERLDNARVRALPGRGWDAEWETHVLAEYHASARDAVVLDRLYLDPLLVDVVPPTFSIPGAATSRPAGFSMRYVIRQPVTPYHVEFTPPPDFAVPASLFTGVETIPLLFNTDADGRPRDVRVARPVPGRGELEQIVTDTFRQWRFAADSMDGKAVGSEGLLAYVTVHATDSAIVYVYGERLPPLRAPMARTGR